MSFIRILSVYLFLQIFIYVDPRFCQVSNSFCLNNYFNFSCNTALLGINFFSFCLSEKGPNFSFIFESFFSGCRIRGIFFFFQHFKAISPLFWLAYFSRVCYNSYLCSSLCSLIVSPLAAFMIFSCQNDSDVLSSFLHHRQIGN